MERNGYFIDIAHSTTAYPGFHKCVEDLCSFKSEACIILGRDLTRREGESSSGRSDRREGKERAVVGRNDKREEGWREWQQRDSEY